MTTFDIGGVSIQIQLFRLGNAAREGDGIPLQSSCLENPMDGKAW